MQANQPVPNKKDQLAMLFREKGLELLPITSIQSNIWFQSQLNSDLNIAYNLRRGFLISGPLDIKKLQLSIIKMITKHEAFRTNFVEVAGSPKKLVKNESSSFELKVEPIPTNSSPTHWLEEKADIPFNFGQQDLFRFRVFQIARDRYAFLMVIHHIICDGFAIDLALKEISIGYGDGEQPLNVYKKGEKTTAPVHTSEKTLNYWKDSLERFPRLHNLPLDHPRPAELNYHGSKMTQTFEHELSDQINNYCKQAHLTPFITLLSVWSILLSRMSSERKVVVGFPISTRTEDTKNDINLLVDTLPLGIEISPDSNFEAHTKSVRNAFFEVYENRDISFYELSEHLLLERTLSNHPVYQLAFTFLENKRQLQLAGTNTEELPLSKTRIKMDLEFHIELDHEKNYRCNVHYNTSLFQASTIDQYVNRFLTLIESCLRNPGQLIKELPIVDQKEKKQLLEFATGKQIELPKSCIHQLFEDLIPSLENKVALIYQEQQLTYGELNRRSNQLAHLLLEKAKDENLIGLLLNGGIETIIGILGVMKAGKAYVPIDPAYPEKRVNFLLRNSGIATLLTNQSQCKPEINQTIFLKDCSGFSHKNPEVVTSLADLIYMIYTSGTTGLPKGVPISHLGILNYAWSKIDQQKITNEDVALQLMSFSFDGFGCEAFPTLLTGGTLVLVDKLSDMDLEEIGNVISSNQVTRFMIVPSTLKLILDHLETEDFKNLKVISLGGEKPDHELLSKLVQLKTGLRLFNEYGPTENSIASTSGTLIIQIPENIGRPTGNGIAAILDDSGNLVPAGIPGELSVGGPGLTSGYFQNPELTASKFFTSPLFPETRLYRTGDLAKWDNKGNIHFLGRSDDQVKVNGVRIELEEVRQTLLNYPGINDCLILNRGSSLEAIIQKVKDQFITNVEDISSFLVEHLPHYMIPATFRTIDHFPVTTHGKIDHEQLQKQSAPLVPSEETYEITNDILTTILKSAWSQVLEVDQAQIDVRSNFFDLGGHSLLLGKLVKLINKQTDLVVDKIDFFKYPSIYTMVRAKESKNLTKPELMPHNRAEIRKNQRNKRLKRQQ